MLTRATPIVLVVAALVPAGTTAQTLEPDVVPMEFVERLLAVFQPGGAPPALLVGELAPPFERVFDIPADGRIIGSVDHGGRVQMAALRLPAGSWSEAAWWEAQLEAGGFERFQNARRRGFGDTPSSGSQFCRASTSMQVSLSPAGDSVDVQLARTESTGVCSRTESGSRLELDSPIPYFDSPAQMRRRGSGSGGGGGEWDAHTHLTGPLTARSVRDHFEAQMVDQGGIPLSSVSDDAIAMSTLRMPDQQGEWWFSVLTVATDPNEGLRIFLRMTAEEGRR